MGNMATELLLVTDAASVAGRLRQGLRRLSLVHPQFISHLLANSLSVPNPCPLALQHWCIRARCRRSIQCIATMASLARAGPSSPCRAPTQLASSGVLLPHRSCRRAARFADLLAAPNPCMPYLPQQLHLLAHRPRACNAWPVLVPWVLPRLRGSALHQPQSALAPAAPLAYTCLASFTVDPQARAVLEAMRRWVLSRRQCQCRRCQCPPARFHVLAQQWRLRRTLLRRELDPRIGGHQVWLPVHPKSQHVGGRLGPHHCSAEVD